MGRQKYRPQMKKKTEEICRKELNEMEASNLSDIEFKVMVIRMDAQQHVKEYRSHKKGPVRNKECNI